MKQSLRTVATQLLNVTNPDEVPKTIAELENDTKLKSETKKLATVAKIEKVERSPLTSDTTKTEDKNLLIKEINSEISSLESIGISFGRPTNSKFGYFESSHPGQAMAMTDEELEKELSAKRNPISHKNQPTTSGGISTWILLNSPTTTPKTVQKETKRPEVINKFIAKPTASIEKVEIDQKIVQKQNPVVDKVSPAPTSVKVPVKPIVRNNQKPTTVKQQIVQTVTKRVTPKLDATTPKTVIMTPVTTVEKTTFATTEKTITSTKNIIQVQKTPLLTTTWRPTIKVQKQNPNRGKFPARTTTTTTTTTTPTPEKKLERITTTKIEKVTFRPIQMIPTPKDEIKVEKPVLAAKIKTVVQSEIPKTTSAPPVRNTTPKIKETTVFKTDFTGSDLIEVPVQTKPPINKVNNVLKVQLKKPVDEVIKTETPVADKEKVVDEKIDEASDQGVSQALNNSQIDLSFDFNPELTKIEMEATTEDPSVTTTKKPRRNSQKRRKNKNKTKRRRPAAATTESNEISTDPTVNDTALQESKVEPETKEGNATKNKKKQVQKPIGTQIYNFLSREIMPSFGMVSLVGLGLGIASYFLYPFGGGISRRNYEVEPNYKYNLGEYGGNYGQSEEEVFSKVLQGMTNNEAKYGNNNDYDQNNYYHYQKFGSPSMNDGKLSKKSDRRYPAAASSPTYKPMENNYELNYRNTEFKYPEVSTTPNYFERQKQSGYTVANDGDGDRQFVVGSVPKEYSYDGGQKTPTYAVDRNGQTEFEQSIAQSYPFSKNTGNITPLQSYPQPEALPLKSGGGYEEIEISPTAVAVEHGPRALKVKRSADEGLMEINQRSRRESVIQLIPPNGSRETEEEEEKDLSNEIFDILDLMIPGKDAARKVHDDKMSNAIDADEKIAKKREEEKLKTHESTTNKAEDVTEKMTSDKLVVTTTSFAETTATPAKIEAEVTTTTTTTTTTQSSVSEESTTVAQSKEVPTDEVAETAEQDLDEATLESLDVVTTAKTEKEEDSGTGFNIFNFVRTIAEVKFRLGLTILKHASEGFARYLGGVQKRINGEE